MTRRIFLTIVLIGCIVFCFKVSANTNKKLENSIKDLKTLSQQQNDKSTVQFENKRKDLENAIIKYNKTKEEYENATLISNSEDINKAIDSSKQTIYSLDFLWLELGSYATKNGANLSLDYIKKSSEQYDLNVSVNGEYINLINFMKDLENDYRLNFKIEDFRIENNDKKSSLNFTISDINIKENDIK